MKNSIGNTLQFIRQNMEVSEDNLLRATSTSDTVFEYVLKRGKPIKCERFSKTKSVDLILKYRRYELLKYVDIKTLLKTNRSNISECYLETILRLYKQNKDFNISCINPFDNSKSLEDTADVYLLYAKYNLVEYLPLLDSNLLLLQSLEDKKENFKTKVEHFLYGDSKRTLLEVMLLKNRQLTVDKILNESLKRNFDIAMILRSYDILQKRVEYDIKPNTYLDDIVNVINKEHSRIRLSNEEEWLLKTLYELFIDSSDKKAVDALINSYRVQLSKGNPNTIKEIEALIELKKRGKPAFIRIGDNHYDLSTNGIEIENGLPGNINHEMGHMLFHNLTDGTIPNEFWGIIDKVKSNPSTLRKVKEYSVNSNEETKRISAWANEKYEEAFPLMNKIIELYNIRRRLKRCYDWELDKKRIRLEEDTYELRKEISEFLSISKKEKIKIYKEKGYSEEDLEVLFSNTFTIEEYVIMHRRIQKREFKEALNSSIYSPSRCIGDIIDAIYQGNFITGKLYYQDEQIKPVTGHGLFYYNYDRKFVFDEVLADFRTIMMSEYSDRYLKELRYYIGDELVDFLNKYYNSIISNVMIEGVEYGR